MVFALLILAPLILVLILPSILGRFFNTIDAIWNIF